MKYINEKRWKTMILVDKNIKERSTEIFVKNYNEASVNAISYDLHIKEIVGNSEYLKEYVLKPGEIVFIKTAEKIHMPDDLMGRIGEKNSRMRQGLCVSGPHYYPGHETYLYLRVQNISAGTIKIKEEDTIAQILFEELKEIPEQTYDNQPGASFNNEDEYLGMARYKDEYEKRMERIKDAGRDLDEKINHIYANILTLMGIFVSIFSLMMVNFTNITNKNMNGRYIATINVSLGIVIALFLGLIILLVNNKEIKKSTFIIYICIIIVLIIALFFLLG